MHIGQLSRVMVVLAVLPGAVARAEDPGAAVRAANDGARDLIADAFKASPTARRLAEDLSRTDVIAYVEMTLSPDTARAGTQLVASTGESRYLRLRINAMLGPTDRVALLAHELWHALEIARAPEVRSQAALRVFYKRAGASTEGRDKFETVGAREAERQAWHEVRGVAAHAAEPEATRADNISVTNGVTNGSGTQHRLGGTAALR